MKQKFIYRHKESITATHTVLHVFYWMEASISHLGYMSPLYAALAGLTIMVHFIQENDGGG